MKRFLQIIVLVIYLAFNQFAQNKELNEYGLYVIDDIKEYHSLVKQDSFNLFVDLLKIIPGIKTDIRYATTNNFLNEKIYPSAKVYLRLPAAIALKKVQDELKQMDYELKIYDAYRPYSVTVKMYITYKDTNYVASAWTGSRHNRGCAVDLTIISSATGRELKMPTGYDDFTERANPDYADLPEEVIKNRELLKDVMQRNGFTVYPTEWWHYDFNGWEKYDITDLDFEQLDP